MVVANWLRNYNTIEYVGIWENLNNVDFNPLKFDVGLAEVGQNVNAKSSFYKI